MGEFLNFKNYKSTPPSLSVDRTSTCCVEDTNFTKNEKGINEKIKEMKLGWATGGGGGGLNTHEFSLIVSRG